MQHENRGYGATVKHGLARCREDDCSFAVCLHADGQYPPESIMPLYKYLAGRVLTALENRVFNLAMTDYHSGFLVYGKRALAAIPFERLGGGFDFDLEVIATARAGGLTIGELPIPTRYAGERSYLNPFLYGINVLGVLVRYLSGRYTMRSGPGQPVGTDAAPGTVSPSPGTENGTFNR